VVRTPTGELMSGAIGRAEQIARETGAFLPNQFANPINPLTHYETTAPEIWAELGESIDASSPASARPGRSPESRAFSGSVSPKSCASRRSLKARSWAAASRVRTRSRASASPFFRRSSIEA